jgi:Cu-processing system permease protein
MEFRQILFVALKELRDRLRNRWVLAVSLVFTVFALVIAYFGGAQQGVLGLRSIEATITSLVSLVIYLIPLIALLLGFDAIVGERERGSLDLLLALPITRLELLLGKYVGWPAALTLSTLLGFGLVAGLARVADRQRLAGAAGRLRGQLGAARARLPEPGRHAVRAGRRPHRASGLAIALWFLFVLVFDLLLLGLLVGLGSDTGGAWFPYLLLLNPRTCSASSTCSRWRRCATSTASPASCPPRSPSPG